VQARLCEKAGDYERAANYYQEGQSLLVEAIPRERQEELLGRAAALRAKSRRPIEPPARIGR
jgi:hypothetical protein